MFTKTGSARKGTMCERKLAPGARMTINCTDGSRWIESARVPGIATADACDALASATDRTVLLHGKNEILAATRLEAAHGGEHGPNHTLIEAHPGDEESGEEPG